MPLGAMQSVMTCRYAQGTTLRHGHPRAVAGMPVGSLTFNASHFTYTPNGSRAPMPRASPRIAHHTPHAAHHAPQTARHAPHGAPHTAQWTAEPQRDHRTLPNNVARNSPRSFFDYASKRCNSNAANSTFEIVARELRAKLIVGPAVPHGARRRAGPAGSEARSPTKVACNSIGPKFNEARKR